MSFLTSHQTTQELRELGDFKRIPEMLEIDGEYQDNHLIGKF